MAGAVAPFTTAEFGTVDPRHSGIASGFNSAVARTGGLIATALASAILVAHAKDLQTGFHWAMAAGAATAAAASAGAFVWLANAAKTR